MNKQYYMYHTHGNEGEKHPYGWAVVGPKLDMYVPDKGLALAIGKFLNKEDDANRCLDELWLKYI